MLFDSLHFEDKGKMMELHEDTLTLDDVGKLPDKKVIEELKKIEIDRHDKEKYFITGTSLPTIEESANHKKRGP